jgi:hypothetical protein
MESDDLKALSTVSVRSRAATKAWETMKSPPYQARRTARLSQEALRIWAQSNGHHCLFLDAPSGNPRTGIVDALLIRIGKSDPDILEIQLVQLKGGGAGMTPLERTRLMEASRSVRLGAAVAMWDRENMSVDFLASAPTPGASAKPAVQKQRRKQP